MAGHSRRCFGSDFPIGFGTRGKKQSEAPIAVIAATVAAGGDGKQTFGDSNEQNSAAFRDEREKGASLCFFFCLMACKQLFA